VAGILAKNLGVNTLKGKTINQHGPSSALRTQPKLPNGLNTPITGDYDTLVNPSIAFDNAFSTSGLPVGYAVYEEQYDGGCAVFNTNTGGSTWTFAFHLPLNSGTDTCADPVVRWSPDGLAAYFVYLSVKTSGTSDLNVLVDSCPIYGCLTKTVLWSGTAGGDFSDFPWIDVHQINNAIVNTQGAPSQASYVYVTFTYFDSSGFDGVDALWSSNYGVAWSGFFVLGEGSCSGAIPPPNSGTAVCNPLVTGARVIGGMYDTISGHGDVLACWYNSDTDYPVDGVFDIQCSHSATNGASWSPSPITVAHNVKYELPFYLCPNDYYEIWWTGMFPSIAITPDGRAHIAFAASSYNYGVVPAPANKVDCGNIEYVRSKPFSYDTSVGLPSSSWLPMATVAGGSLAQGFPTLATQVLPALPPTSLGYRLYLFYYDAKNSPTTCAAPLVTKCYANILYDVYMRTSDNGGGSFTSDTRITDQSSLVNLDYVTSYLDATATSHSAWVIWPDRANQLPCSAGVPGCLSPPPILDYDTDNAVYAQQVSIST
jgi:hypothetical protein